MSDGVAVSFGRRSPASVLSLSADRKTTAFARWEQGKARWVPTPNAFGMTEGPVESGGTCTGVTDFCRHCYVTKNPWPAAHALLDRNAAAMRAAGTREHMRELLEDMFAGWRVTMTKADVQAGRVLPRTFRIHYSGDFFSLAYAKAWADVIRANPDVVFWAYTRSFHGRVNVLPVLAGIPNLTLYVSVDEGNAAAAKRALVAYPMVKRAWCGETWDAATAVARSVGGSIGARCPEGTGRFPLVLEDGRGACEACGLCLKGVNNVRFSVKKGA